MKQGRNASLPKGWYERFLLSLAENCGDESSLNAILPRCDLPKLARFLMSYIEPRPELAAARKKRGREMAIQLGRRIRTLQRELKSSVIFDPEMHRERELEQLKLAQKKCPQAYGTKRLGVSGNHFMLYIIEEYLRFKSGMSTKPQDLATLVKAALVAEGKTVTEFYGHVDSDLLSRGLRNFKRNSPVYCNLAKGMRSVEIIEAYPPQFLN